ncbi:protease modulator HflC [Pantoea sp. Aalb]|uniref:protease modulator HflC n=1 Tax=Pantoea sp. Aalb TaxID=2576762 RepID=UPI001327DEC7|nr:protease modulator HflC [Pantoea sp. Aalb]MXP67680.1 protease modulator HflC [Pantoea sp. Aalb]
MRKSIIVFTMIIPVFLLLFSFFIIQEGQRGIVLRFGKVVRDDENRPKNFMPGPHFRIPFIEKVKYLDARIQTMDNQADRFLTKEKKDLIIDSYIKWRITDFSRYYLTTNGGDIFQAEVLLKRKFNDRLRSDIGRLDVKDIVTDSRGRLTIDVRNALNSGRTNEQNDIEDTKKVTDKIITSTDVAKIKLRTNTKELSNQNSMAALGIHVVDVRIKQINLPIEVSDAIYNRMRAERETVARSQRSQGLEEAEKVRATADYQATHTLAEAQRMAIIYRGEGDAEAARIFTRFNQDPDFYFFIRSLHAYENSFSSNNQDILILDPKNDFFYYMKPPYSFK